MISFIFACIILFALVWFLGKHGATAPKPAPAGWWNVFMFDSPTASKSTFHESFAYDLREAELLSGCTDDEVEDEAASYASFASYMNLGMMTPDTQIIVTSSHHSKVFVFRPDYEAGSLIGVELDTRESNSHIDTISTPA